MQHKCKVTVIDKKCFENLQSEYLADKKSGPCPFYNIGDEFVFERYGDEDTFWRAGNGNQCAEAWDCISRYIYTALRGGSIMRGWTNDERLMIACCNDGTRPVIFKIERQDYKVVRTDEPDGEGYPEKLTEALRKIPGLAHVEARPDKSWIEIFPEKDMRVSDEIIKSVVERYDFDVLAID